MLVSLSVETPNGVYYFTRHIQDQLVPFWMVFACVMQVSPVTVLVLQGLLISAGNLSCAKVNSSHS